MTSRTSKSAQPKFSRHQLRLVLVAIIILAWIIFTATFQPFSIGSVYCQLKTPDMTTLCPAVTSQATNALLGKSMLSVSLADQLQQIQQQQGYVSFQIKRLPPHRLDLIFYQEEALVLVQCQNQNFAITTNGQLVSLFDSDLAHPLTGSEAVCGYLTQTTSVNANLLNSLGLLANSESLLKQSISQVTWQDEKTAMIHLQEKTILVDLENLPTNLERARLTLDRPDWLGEWSTLDVRFEKPIVK